MPRYTASVNVHSTQDRQLHVVWIVLILLVAASRLLAIPAVPWEQDEALFAAASLDTNLVEHRPHPPGFPLWIGAGKAMTWLLGDPVVGLQLLSALASILTVWWLGRAWAAATGELAGLAAAILYAFLPGVWFHAPRAFSTTPAVALALGAVVAWQRRLHWWGLAAWVAAVLVRPPLAPPLLVMAIAAAIVMRLSWRQTIVMAAVGATAVAAGFVPLIIDTGGVGAFLAATSSHGSGHAGALHLAPWHVPTLGLVRAIGGVIPSVLAGALAAFGAWGLWRRDRRSAVSWLILLTVTVLWLVGAHNRTYPRYTLPALALMAGPAGLALTAIWRHRSRATVATAAVLAAASATLALPAVHAITTQPFPPLAAMAAAARQPPPGSIVIDGGLSPFGDLLSLAGRADRPIVWRPLLADGRIPLEILDGRWTFVWAAGTPRRWVSAPMTTPETTVASGTRLESLSQDRYLTAWRSDRGAVVLTGPPVATNGRLQLNGATRFLIQPTPPGSWIGLGLHVDGAPVHLTVELGGQRLGSVTLPTGSQPTFIDLPSDPSRSNRPAVLELSVDPGGDPASTVVDRIWVDDPSTPLAAYQVTPEQLPLCP